MTHLEKLISQDLVNLEFSQFVKVVIFENDV